jgi:hypothetical protein
MFFRFWRALVLETANQVTPTEEKRRNPRICVESSMTLVPQALTGPGKM